MDNKMSSKPPLPKSAEDFILAAEKKPIQKDTKDLPWLQEGVRPEMLVAMSLRLKEEYILKLKYIGENSKYSQQSFARECLEKAIDNMIQELIS